MIACVDVHYPAAGGARAACVLARGWEDASPLCEHVSELAGAQPYRSGAFYERELPSLLAVLASVEVSLEAVVVDAYVWLGPGRPGLGARLFEALGGAIAVVGVAKTRFADAGEVSAEVLRGSSRRPLFVSAAGMSLGEAAERVRAMAGGSRIPALLARADRLSRGGAPR
ncbi:MAG: endonuclease V [Myxococcales bacterium]